MMIQIKSINLLKLITRRRQQKRLPLQSTIPGLAPPSLRWYVALLRCCIETFWLVTCGIALGIVLLVLLHYLGLER